MSQMGPSSLVIQNVHNRYLKNKIKTIFNKIVKLFWKGNHYFKGTPQKKKKKPDIAFAVKNGIEMKENIV